MAVIKSPFWEAAFPHRQPGATRGRATSRVPCVAQSREQPAPAQPSPLHLVLASLHYGWGLLELLLSSSPCECSGSQCCLTPDCERQLKAGLSGAAAGSTLPVLGSLLTLSWGTAVILPDLPQLPQL